LHIQTHFNAAVHLSPVMFFIFISVFILALSHPRGSLAKVPLLREIDDCEGDRRAAMRTLRAQSDSLLRPIFEQFDSKRRGVINSDQFTQLVHAALIALRTELLALLRKFLARKYQTIKYLHRMRYLCVHLVGPVVIFNLTCNGSDLLRIAFLCPVRVAIARWLQASVVVELLQHRLIPRMEANLANISNKMWRGIAPKSSALQIDLEMTQQEVRSLGTLDSASSSSSCFHLVHACSPCQYPLFAEKIILACSNLF
jgi:hypothetical protein